MRDGVARGGLDPVPADRREIVDDKVRGQG
jgi:hypothetical protein